MKMITKDLIAIGIALALVLTARHCMADNLPINPIKPCLVCLKAYQACTKKVNQSPKPDEDATMECEDVYYQCFYKFTCQNEGSKR